MAVGVVAPGNTNESRKCVKLVPCTSSHLDISEVALGSKLDEEVFLSLLNWWG